MNCEWKKTFIASSISSTKFVLNRKPRRTAHHSTLRSASDLLRPHATFFILGWIAERLPHLIREIYERGHEIASHGYTHQLCNSLFGDDLKEDLAKSKKLLEELIGKSVSGYRAPSFSIDTNTLDLLEEMWLSIRFEF